jgi:hypothetical protein
MSSVSILEEKLSVCALNGVASASVMLNAEESRPGGPDESISPSVVVDLVAVMRCYSFEAPRASASSRADRQSPLRAPRDVMQTTETSPIGAQSQGASRLSRLIDRSACAARAMAITRGEWRDGLELSYDMVREEMESKWSTNGRDRRSKRTKRRGRRPEMRGRDGECATCTTSAIGTSTTGIPAASAMGTSTDTAKTFNLGDQISTDDTVGFARWDKSTRTMMPPPRGMARISGGDSEAIRQAACSQFDDMIDRAQAGGAARQGRTRLGGVGTNEGTDGCEPRGVSEKRW